MIKAEFFLLSASIASEEILICEKAKITSEILEGFLVLSWYHAAVGARRKFFWNLRGGRLVRHVERSFGFTITSLSALELKKKASVILSVVQKKPNFLLGCFHGQDAYAYVQHVVCGREAWGIEGLGGHSRKGWRDGLRKDRELWKQGENWKLSCNLSVLLFAGGLGGAAQAGAWGGFLGHYLKAAGRSSSPAFPLPGLDTEMAHPAWSGWIRHLRGRDSWRMCGDARRVSRPWLRAALMPVCACYKAACAGLGIVWDIHSIPLHLQEFSMHKSTYTCDSTAEGNHFTCPV